MSNLGRQFNNVNFDIEKPEFDWYNPEHGYPEGHGAKMMENAKTAPVRNLSTEEVKGLENSHAPSIVPGAIGRMQVRFFARKYGKDYKNIRNQVASDTAEPALVMKTKEGNLRQVGGTHRTSMRVAMKKPVKAVVFEEPK